MKIRGNTVGTPMKPEKVVEAAGGGTVDLSNYYTKDESDGIVEQAKNDFIQFLTEMDYPSKAYVYEEAESVAEIVVSREIGDISTALDHIIELQEELIGGSGDVKTITFTIDHVEYTAIEGMTWGEWYESAFNTADIYMYIDSNGEVCGDGGIVLTNNATGDNVSADDLIMADGDYWLYI